MSSDTTMMGEAIRFQQTHWSLVRSCRDPGALDALIQIYWKPLYFFVRQNGYDNETAKDIVQDFLATLLEREALTKVDPSRGRFRTFLLAALTNYMKDWKKAASRQKRGGGHSLQSLDYVKGDEEFARQVAAGETPEQTLNRAWARSLWERAVSELEGAPAHREAFRLYLADSNYDDISIRTGLSESAAKTAVHRLKIQLRDRLRTLIGHTVSDEAELEVELEEFRTLLGR